MKRLLLIFIAVMTFSGSAIAEVESLSDIKHRQYEKVRPKQEALLRDLANTSDPRDRYNIYDELSKLYFNQLDEVSYIEKKIELAISLEEKDLELEGYVDMCRNYYDHDNTDKVKEYSAKVEQKTGAKGRYWVLAKYYEVEAMFWTTDMRGAWDQLQELSRYADKTGDELDRAVVNVLTADIYSFLNQDDRAYNLIDSYFPVLVKQSDSRYKQMAYVSAIEAMVYTDNLNEAYKLTQQWEEMVENPKFSNDRYAEEMRWTVQLEYLSYYIMKQDVNGIHRAMDKLWDNNYIPTEWSLCQFALMRAMINRDYGEIEDVEADVEYLLQRRNRYRPQYLTVLASAYWNVKFYSKASKAFRDANDALNQSITENMIREVERYGELSKRFSEETAIDDTRLREARSLHIALTVGVILAFLSLIILVGLLYRNVKISRKLKQMNTRIEDNSKRVAAVNANLANAIKQEEISCRKKNEFIANISHEIRTPLNAIVGFSEILAASCENNDESREFTQIIRANSDLMLELVNQIIDERSEENAALHLEKINVAEVARTGLYSLSALVKDGVELVFSCDEPEVMLTTDRYRLQQLLTNLLGNAANFTEHGAITLDIQVDEHYVTFSVIDTGCGIPKGKETAIFEQFEKGSETSKGSGLGLFICRSITNQLYGKLYVDTEYTQGAKFVFKHPTMLQSMISDNVVK